jgi:hypothetical protein
MPLVNTHLGLAFFLVGCGLNFDVNRVPISFDVPPELSSRALVLSVLTASISQLGGVVSSNSAQIVRVTELADCPIGIGGNVPLHARNTIQLCPDSFTAKDRLTWVLKHELGHVLGYRAHLPCDSQAVMVSQETCYTALPGHEYHMEDIEAICSATRCGTIQ